nr:ribonuclease H-like domain-containing protein [Tanacetum cinerariifolium]
MEYGHRDNNCTVEFDAFGFSVNDFLTHHILLNCDSSGDLYPVTQPSLIPHALLSVSLYTWHKRLGHPGKEVLCSLVSRQFISCNKEKSPHVCHACQLGKHVRFPFSSSDSVVTRCFEIVHSDSWTSSICDHGDEFDDTNLLQLFVQHDIQFRFSCPQTSQQNVALTDSNWRDAMYDEYNALIRNSTWILHADGSLTRYKARLVANGRNQQYGVDCDDTFSPVVKAATICTVLSMFPSQKKYAMEFLNRAHMASCNPTRTPVVLKYLTCTRPNISYDVQQVCVYMHDPREPYFLALKRILQYVCGTLDFGLQLYASSNYSLVAYSDADWAGCPTTRRSSSGYCVFLGDNLLSWSSKRQHTLFRSSTEAEYRGVANVVSKNAWLRNLLLELHMPLSTITLVYCDNVNAIYLTANPVQH